MVGLVPARGGSVRVKDKNLREIGGVPLVGIAIREALLSEVFSHVICSTDSPQIAKVAKRYGAAVVKRPERLSTAEAPDLWWVNHVMSKYDEDFAILRPTSPFRTASTIQRAAAQFAASEADSLRAVQKVSQRPEKMWRLLRLDEEILRPYLSDARFAEQSSTFEELWVQNGCIEMARGHVLPRDVHGSKIAAFFTEGLEGFDINTEEDLSYACWLNSTLNT